MDTLDTLDTLHDGTFTQRDVAGMKGVITVDAWMWQQSESKVLDSGRTQIKQNLDRWLGMDTGSTTCEITLNSNEATRTTFKYTKNIIHVRHGNCLMTHAVAHSLHDVKIYSKFLGATLLPHDTQVGDLRIRGEACPVMDGNFQTTSFINSWPQESFVETLYAEC